MPCYVYQDAVCAPAAQFVPNWSQPGRAQPPITLSTPPAPHLRDAHAHDTHNAASERKTEEPNKIQGNQGKSHSSKSGSRQNIFRAQGDSTLLAQNDSEKTSKKHPRHNHHHRHRQDFRHHNQSAEPQTDESKVNSVMVHGKSGANSDLDKLATNDNTGVPSSNNGGNESMNTDVSNGANTSDKTEKSDLEQPEAGGWKDKFFFAAIIVVSVCLVVLTIVTLSHLRNILIRRKLSKYSCFCCRI